VSFEYNVPQHGLRTEVNPWATTLVQPKVRRPLSQLDQRVKFYSIDRCDSQPTPNSIRVPLYGTVHDLSK